MNVQEFLDIKLEDESCEACQGRRHDSYSSRKCCYCNGTGKQPTEAGQKLLDFIQRHIKHMIRETMDL